MARTRKKINLALQGGGAHGAYSWGVLDALLEDGRLDFEAITATSAGAMNAAALAYGLHSGGPDKARQVLQDFWEAVAEAGAFYSPVKRNPFELAMGLNPFAQDWRLDNSAAFSWFEQVTRTVSPYQFNPLNINPLRDILEDVIDFTHVHACTNVKIFVTATHVKTGDAHIFRNTDVTLEVLLASAALPFLFQAVEVNGEHYWDGGYTGNPALWPLFYEAESRDLLLVHVNPVVRDKLPTQAYEIENRLNEITFNASLLRELRAVAFVQKLLREDMLKARYQKQYTDILLHAIRADDVLAHLSVASKFDTDMNFLNYLKDLGRKAAQDWLAAHYRHLGVRGTVDIKADYLS